MDAADLVVTMTGYSDEVDEVLYAEGGPPSTASTTTVTTVTTATTTAGS
jgi:hypothetical protein